MLELVLLVVGLLMGIGAFVFWIAGKLQNLSRSYPRPRPAPQACPCHVCQGMTRKAWAEAIERCPARLANQSPFSRACSDMIADAKAGAPSTTPRPGWVSPLPPFPGPPLGVVRRAPHDPVADSPCYSGHAYRAGKCQACGREEPKSSRHYPEKDAAHDSTGRQVELCRNCSQPLANPSPGCMDHSAVAALIQASKPKAKP